VFFKFKHSVLFGYCVVVSGWLVTPSMPPLRPN
jgi:hypothetical protein